MGNELLSCPFCGGAATVRGYSGLFWGRCGRCDTNGPPKTTEAEAIAAWNTRTPTDGSRSGGQPVGGGLVERLRSAGYNSFGNLELHNEAADALEWIAANYENCDINHVDFRVEAKHRADAALEALGGGVEADEATVKRVAKAVLFPELIIPECEDEWTVAEWQARAAIAALKEPTC